MKHLRSVVVVFGLLLVASSVVYGQNMRLDMPTFESFDLNNDGVITKQELEKARELRASERQKQGRGLRGPRSNYSFSEIDLNGDGFITKEEFEKHQVRRR